MDFHLYQGIEICSMQTGYCKVTNESVGEFADGSLLFYFIDDIIIMFMVTDACRGEKYMSFDQQ